MQSSLLGLSKQAIDAALKADWEKSIELNTQILDREPNNIEAMVRMGRAYLQTKQYTKAKKLFEKVLDIDPINQIAQKNLAIAKEKKTTKANHANLDPTLFIKEPGTSTEVKLQISAPRLTAESFLPGQVLTVKCKKDNLDIYSEDRLLGTITDPDIVRRVYASQTKVIGSFIRGTGKEAVIVLRATLPIFRAEKQDVRPYLKSGTIDEPELDLSEIEDEEGPQVEHEHMPSEEE